MSNFIHPHALVQYKHAVHNSIKTKCEKTCISQKLQFDNNVYAIAVVKLCSSRTLQYKIEQADSKSISNALTSIAVNDYRYDYAN